MGDVYFLRRLIAYKPMPANGESAKAIVAASGTTKPGIVFGTFMSKSAVGLLVLLPSA